MGSEVYVIGSGASLLGLTDQEKSHLSEQTTVAMNKYLLFWEKIGVWPTHFFLADHSYPATRVLQESFAIARRTRRPVHFLLDEHFSFFYGKGAFHPARLYYTLRRAGADLALRKFLYKPWLSHHDVTYFQGPGSWTSSMQWATSLDDPMYFWRGSLTVLINLICVLGLGRRIKLLGIDLSTPDSFYQDEIQRRPDLWDEHMRRQQSSKLTRHASAESYKNMPGITAKWPEVMAHATAAGFEIVCCNAKSQLVTEGLCEYAPILESQQT